jgi:TDG/mug DNA glycosylase family protein
MRTLPDYIRPNLDLIIVGTNPGEYSAMRGHYYARAGNNFWPLLHESGLVPVRLMPDDDARINDYGIGLTDLVKRPTVSVSDLTRDEMRAAVAPLRRKLLRAAPRVVAFNGKAQYEVFAGRRNVTFGVQPERIGGAVVFVMPSTSRRTTAYQRDDKLAFFRQLAALVRTASDEAAAAVGVAS